jgi:hypothetical protein
VRRGIDDWSRVDPTVVCCKRAAKADRASTKARDRLVSGERGMTQGSKRLSFRNDVLGLPR